MVGSIVALRFYLLFAIIIKVDASLRNCTIANVTRCTAETEATDVLFLLDSSNSMWPSFFYNQMLDYVQDLQCAMNASLPNNAGMLQFSNRINVAIPLAHYW